MSQSEFAAPVVRGEALLRLRDVEGRTCLGRSTIYRYVRAGRFPPPVQLGPGTVRWKETEIETWMAALTPANSA